MTLLMDTWYPEPVQSSSWRLGSTLIKITGDAFKGIPRLKDVALWLGLHLEHQALCASKDVGGVHLVCQGWHHAKSARRGAA